MFVSNTGHLCAFAYLERHEIVCIAECFDFPGMDRTVVRDQ